MKLLVVGTGRRDELYKIYAEISGWEVVCLAELPVRKYRPVQILCDDFQTLTEPAPTTKRTYGPEVKTRKGKTKRW